MDRLCDPITHDLVLKGGDLQRVTGAADTVQAVKIRLLTVAGECFLDPTLGWLDFDRLFGKGVSLAYVRARLIAEIEAVAGVVKGSAVVDDLTFDAEGRSLAITWHAAAVNGEAIGSTVDVGVGA